MLVRGESLRGAARLVQGAHQQLDEIVAQRMGGHQLLEPGHLIAATTRMRPQPAPDQPIACSRCSFQRTTVPRHTTRHRHPPEHHHATTPSAASKLVTGFSRLPSAEQTPAPREPTGNSSTSREPARAQPIAVGRLLERAGIRQRPAQPGDQRLQRVVHVGGWSSLGQTASTSSSAETDRPASTASRTRSRRTREPEMATGTPTRRISSGPRSRDVHTARLRSHRPVSWRGPAPSAPRVPEPGGQSTAAMNCAETSLGSQPLPRRGEDQQHVTDGQQCRRLESRGDPPRTSRPSVVPTGKTKFGDTDTLQHRARNHADLQQLGAQLEQPRTAGLQIQGRGGGCSGARRQPRPE